MLEDSNYLSYKENEELIQEYFNALFVFREKKAVDVLANFSQLKGFVIDDYQACYFSTEYPDKDSEDYISEEGVLFDFSAPFVKKDCEVILTYEEFYQVVKEKYAEYARNHLDKSGEIMRLLECLKTTISNIIGHFEYLKYTKTEELIQEYFNALFRLRKEKVVEALKRFSQLKGYIINDYLACYFTIEYTDKDSEEYSSNGGVLFDFGFPYASEDCAIIFNYEEFYQVTKERYEEYAGENLDKKGEIMRLLECLKAAISDVIGHS